MKINKKEVLKLAENVPIDYERVFICYCRNKGNIEATRKELQEYVVKGY
ncbi:MAG: hypothetical protein PHT02_00840 [Tissierellia bacterium]|nr:hypothetical protein [Tissierellia bacterium]